MNGNLYILTTATPWKNERLKFPQKHGGLVVHIIFLFDLAEILKGGWLGPVSHPSLESWSCLPLTCF